MLLDAAAAVFAEDGVDAPAKTITDRAELGVGTLYRHFPRRSDLILAILDRELENCALEGQRLLAEHDPAEALFVWFDSYVGLVRAKQGLAEALHSADPAYAGLHEKVWGVLLPVATSLLDAATAHGAVTATVSARDLLSAVALLCQSATGRDLAFSQRVVRLLLQGLRAG